MKFKYTISKIDNTQLAELKNHLAINGYNAEWLDEQNFTVPEEMTGYTDTILVDRGIDDYSRTPVVKWYDADIPCGYPSIRMHDITDFESVICHLTFPVGETTEDGEHEDDKAIVYMDMCGRLDDTGSPVAYADDDAARVYCLSEGECKIALPDAVRKRLEELTKEIVMNDCKKTAKEREKYYTSFAETDRINMSWD